MNREDTFRAASVRGHIRGRWVSGAEGARSSYPEFDVHNTLTYSAADVLAAAYGGDSTRIPRYIGFVYGPELVQLPPVSRDETFRTIDSLCSSFGLNMQVDRFSRPPTVGNYSVFGTEDEDSSDSTDSDSPYDSNVVEFHAVTRSGRNGVYPMDTDESSAYAGPLGKDMYLYRAVLLGDGKYPCVGDPYTVLAVADLMKNGSYRQKPENYELAFDWRVVFE